MSAQALLERLDGVRQLGDGRWIARCSAHKDGRPSLSVREAGDEHVLVHCFAGCSADDVLKAAGLDWSALFAERPSDWPGAKFQRMREPRYDREAMACFKQELGVAFIIMRDVADGVAVDPARLARARRVLLEVWSRLI